MVLPDRIELSTSPLPRANIYEVFRAFRAAAPRFPTHVSA
jgi:hypothetical protein